MENIDDRLAPIAPVLIKTTISAVDLLIGAGKLERALRLQLHTKKDPKGELIAAEAVVLTLEAAQRLGEGLIRMAIDAKRLGAVPPRELN